MQGRPCWLLVPCLLLFAFTVPADARGQLQAGPTQLEILPGNQSTRLQLRNTGDAPVAAQVRLYHWQQHEGEDRLIDTDEVVASPAIVELPAGAEQLVRIVRTGPSASGQDRTYRVVVDELPAEQPEASSRIALRMRYVIPVYLRADDARAPALTCWLETSLPDLRCRNDGGQAAQFGASSLRLADDARLELSAGLYGYVLPGSLRRWSLPIAAGDPALRAPVHLDTWINGQARTLAIDVRP